MIELNNCAYKPTKVINRSEKYEYFLTTTYKMLKMVKKAMMEEDKQDQTDLQASFFFLHF